eukprot:TRINITY_DN9102_c0_g2_i1.p1 TRINITY_DN9102_c0_g2~~TRINITY_DN9102_c0_g2_i1.p1  ORF type:complete len:308 (-),score=32.92 TRINITY_DN9102_c0_g2_i1:29-952(-)
MQIHFGFASPWTASLLFLLMGTVKCEIIYHTEYLDVSESVDHTGPVDVCFFLNTDTARDDTDGRSKATAVVKTWGAKPAQGSRIFYFVDEATPARHLPEEVLEDQIIRIIRTDYEHFPERSRLELMQLNTKTLTDSCAWFAIVDDDVYVNTAGIVAKTSVLNPSDMHYMGAVYRGYMNGADFPFVHGDFTMLSNAAVPLLADVAVKCNDWETGAGDVKLGSCIDQFGYASKLPATVFFNFYLNNSRESKSPSTFQEVVATAKTGGWSLDCLDFVHKLSADEIFQFQALLKGSAPCEDDKRVLQYSGG